jgi:hypothetical protein
MQEAGPQKRRKRGNRGASHNIVNAVSGVLQWMTWRVAENLRIFNPAMRCTAAGDRVISRWRPRQMAVEERYEMHDDASSPPDAATLPFATIPLVSASAPTDPLPAPEELVVLVESLSHYRELYTRQHGVVEEFKKAAEIDGRFEAEAVAGRPTRRRRRLELRGEHDEYTALARRVFALGLHFSIDEESKPHIAGTEEVSSNIDCDALEKSALAAGITDLEALYAPRLGATSHNPELSRATVYSSNAATALKAAYALEHLLNEEIADGSIRQRDTPFTVPMHGVPLGVVTKPPGLVLANGGKNEDGSVAKIRITPDLSWPLPDEHGGDVDEAGFPYAPNTAVLKEDLGDFEWLSVETIGRAVYVLAFPARLAGRQLLGSCYDFAKWFRQIPVRSWERWKQSYVWRGLFLTDERVVMGSASSADIAQRLSFIVILIVLWDLDAAFEKEFAHRSDGPWHALNTWRRRRLAYFNNDAAQARLYWLHPYQDDTPSIVIDILADWLDASVRSTLSRLGISLSDKELPYADVFDAIGAKFCLRSGKMSIRDETLLTYRLQANDIVEAQSSGFKLQTDFVESFIGLHEWVCHFFPDGPRYCNAAHRSIAFALKKKHRTTGVSLRFAEDVAFVLENFEPVFVIDRRCYCHGGSAVCSDASTKDGWGVFAGCYYACGTWSAETVEAAAQFRKEQRGDASVSISPLELLTIAFLVYLVGKIHGRDEILCGGTWFVGRSDSSSTCDVINSGRLSSVYMAEALDAVIAAERAVGLRVQLQHIDAEDNQIADLLSHGRQLGRLQKALALMEPRFGKPCCVTIPPTFVAGWERRVREACRNREAVAEARD